MSFQTASLLQIFQNYLQIWIKGNQRPVSLPPIQGLVHLDNLMPFVSPLGRTCLGRIFLLKATRVI